MRWRRPRTRGGGPTERSKRTLQMPSAPHTRGWSGADRRVIRPGGSAPHTGGGPHITPNASACTASAPYTRGWSDDGIVTPGLTPVGPAHAGVVRDRPMPGLLQMGRPRTRGDGPDGEMRRSSRESSAPHTRGWSDGFCYGIGLGSVGPAHAGGGAYASELAAGEVPSAPHTRGWSAICLIGWKSAPHTRGWSDHLRRGGASVAVGSA